MRLFIALDIDRGALEGVHPAIEFLSLHSALLKPVLPGSFHITLKFLGECSAGLADDLLRGFTSLVPAGGALPYELRGLGAFPDLDHAQVLWCGVSAEKFRVRDMYLEIERFAGRFGFQPEKRSFAPHLTLARVRKGMKLTSSVTEFLKANAGTGYGRSAFRQITLYSSKLTPGGPVYNALGKIILPEK
jgi:2'-5' RNA ligase